MKPKVAIAGATGFIGRWFIDRYADQYELIALSRKEMESGDRPNVEWRKLDMYSLTSTVDALQGADYALYLVHSMQPSTRLSQGDFDDTDLLLADNFVRAATQVGIKQIIFVGGILPKESSDFSQHLRSRYEVEKTLGSGSPALTALRAGIIVGPGGSSFQIIKKLVERLPMMLCPKWTLSNSQPISLDDTLKIIDHCLGNTSTFNEAIEIGSTHPITYMEMMQTTARILHKKRLIRSVPFFSLGLSKLWVALFSDSSTTFVSPLIESLRHTMTITEHEVIKKMGIKYISFEDAARETLKDNRLPKIPAGKASFQQKNTVRSVQRISTPNGQNAAWVAQEYMHWLPKSLKGLLKVQQEGDLISFEMFGVSLLQLLYVADRSDSNRQLFYIAGGKLVKRVDYGWLEFRSMLEGQYVMAAIHEFVPRLPWFVYVNSQALVHLWVMRRFGKHIRQSAPLAE